MSKIIFLLFNFLTITWCYSQIGPNDAGALMGLPKATDLTEINAILNPQVGAIVYNLDDQSIYHYTGSTAGWQKQGEEHTGTTGSVFFADIVANNGEPTEDNNNFFWDDTNNRLGIGTNSPDAILHLKGNTGSTGIFKLEGTEPDIIFNDTNGGFNTFTFQNAGINKMAIGSRDDDNFYITINNGGWDDDAFVIKNSNSYVGMSVSDPQERLHVGGKVRINTLDTGADSDQIVVADSDGLLKKITAANLKQDADEVNTVASTLDLNGDGNVNTSDIIDTDGDGITETTSQDVFQAITPITSKAGRVFYPPSIEIDASTISTVDEKLNLYDQYKAQFEISVSNGMKSTSAPATIPIYTAAELYYYVTYADPDVFNIISIDDTGELTYRILNIPSDYNTLINVVFVVK